MVHNGQDKNRKLTFISKIGVKDNICQMLLQENLHNEDNKNKMMEIYAAMDLLIWIYIISNEFAKPSEMDLLIPFDKIK